MNGILKWERNENADGYVIERQTDSQWQFVVTVCNKDTAQIKLFGLDKSEDNIYRVRCFVYGPEGETVFGEEPPVIVNVPYIYDEVIEGLRVGGRIKDVIRLNWKPIEEATGYIIEQKTDTDWKRVVKLNQLSPCTYRITGLQPATTYNFRVAGYLEGKGRTDIGPYSEITASTTE